MSKPRLIEKNRSALFYLLLGMSSAFVVFIVFNNALKAASPFIELGPADVLALDQPRVTIEIFTDETGSKSLGPEFLSSLLLDTGASSVLVVGGAVTELEQNPHGFQIDGTFLEQGVAGFTEFDVTAPYRVDFAGTDGIRQTLTDVRILSNKESNFGSFSGIVGMPGMIERITTIDYTAFLRGDIINFVDVFFPEMLPPDTGHRYTVPVFPVDFEQVGDPPFPTAVPLPFMTAAASHQGVSRSGSFLFDTGAQTTILSEQFAFDIGLDTNGNGDLTDEAVDFFPVGGIGGEVNAPVLAFDKLLLPTEEGVDLVWTNMTAVVLDIDPSIEGVFGSNLLTSGWFGAVFGGLGGFGGLGDIGDLGDLEDIDGLGDLGDLGDILGDIGGIGGTGYINNMTFDFRGMLEGNGKLLFDLNPELDQVITPPSAIPNGLISLRGKGETYRQDFDSALGPSGSSKGMNLPTGWSTKTGQTTNIQISESFPGATVSSGTYNAGEGDDRTLANGSTDQNKENVMELHAEITGESDVRAIRLEFDIEAWEGNASLGEAAYSVSLGVESENGFDTLVNFNEGNKISTGATLSPGPLNGNAAENRVSFDSGIVETDISAGSNLRIKFDAKSQDRTIGVIFGVDNVVFRSIAAGDTDGNGVVDPFDIIRIQSAQKFGKGPSDATWSEGDFDQDDDVDPFDIIEIQKTVQEGFPKSYSNVTDEAAGESVNLIVDPLSGKLTVDTQGLQLVSVVIESQKGIFNAINNPDWDVSGEFSADDKNIISNAVFGTSFSGIDDLGDSLINLAVEKDIDLLADLSVIYLELGQAEVKIGNVTLSVPEPESIILFTIALTVLGVFSAKRRVKRSHTHPTLFCD